MGKKIILVLAIILTIFVIAAVIAFIYVVIKRKKRRVVDTGIYATRTRKIDKTKLQTKDKDEASIFIRSVQSSKVTPPKKTSNSSSLVETLSTPRNFNAPPPLPKRPSAINTPPGI